MLTKEKISEVIEELFESGVIADALAKHGWEEDPEAQDNFSLNEDYLKAIDDLAGVFFAAQNKKEA